LKLKEMSLKEAAAVSGMTVAALKVASHRALKTCARCSEDRTEERDYHTRSHRVACREFAAGGRLRPPVARALGWLLFAALMLGFSPSVTICRQISRCACQQRSS